MRCSIESGPTTAERRARTPLHSPPLEPRAAPVGVRTRARAAQTVLAAAMLGLLTLAPSETAGQELSSGDVLITGGWLFTGLEDVAMPNPGLLVRNGAILELGTSPEDATDAFRLRLSDDEFVLPGLFDLHAHYAVDLFGEGRVDEAEVNPLVFLANGVTSTFPGGEVDPVGMMEARRRIDAGEQIGPRIYNSGPYFGTARPGWDHDAMTADSIRADVRRWAALGARGFKAKGIRAHQLAVLIEEAHRQGRTVTGHLDSGFRRSVNPRDAILMGIDRIEHFLGGDALSADRSAYASLQELDVERTEVAEQIALFLERGVRFDATLTAYGYFGGREAQVYEYWQPEMDLLTPYARAQVEARLPRAVNEQFERIYHVKRSTVKAFYDAGGKDWITLGTDHPSWGEFFSGFGAHRELHAMVVAGIPEADALRIGSINGARAIGVGDKLGTLEPGKWADLFVVQGDPLTDIRNTRNVRYTMKGGVLYDAPALLASAMGRLGPASEAEADWWKGSKRFR